MLPNITSLTYLEIENYVSDSELPVLTNIIQSCPTLEVLVLEGVDNTAHALAQLVVSPGNLKKLTISRHDITGLFPHNIKNIKDLTIPSTILQPLASLLPNATSLTYLEIANSVSDSDLPALIYIVQSHPTLEVLVLEHFYQKSYSLTELTPMLMPMSKYDITGLLSRNNQNIKKLTIPREFFLPLAALYPNTTSFTYLEIKGDVSDSDLAALTNIVQSHPTLEVLKISVGVMFDSTKLSFLVEAAGNSRLKKLTIGKCDSKDEVLNYENTKPKKLVISYLLIQSLAGVLPNITSLAYLKITGYVLDSHLPILINIVQSHPTLEVLDIRAAIPHSPTIQWQLSSLLVKAAGNSQLKELRLPRVDYD